MHGDAFARGGAVGKVTHSLGHRYPSELWQVFQHRCVLARGESLSAGRPPSAITPSATSLEASPSRWARVPPPHACWGTCVSAEPPPR